MTNNKGTSNPLIIPDYKELADPRTNPHRKLNDDIIKEIADLIRKGNYIDVACASKGINKQSYLNWLKVGSRLPEDSARLEKKFSLAILQAEAESIILMNDNIREHARNTYKADAFRLERRFANKYGKKTEIEITTNPLESLTMIIDQSKKELLINKDQEVESISQTDTRLKVKGGKTTPESQEDS